MSSGYWLFLALAASLAGRQAGRQAGQRGQHQGLHVLPTSIKKKWRKKSRRVGGFASTAGLPRQEGRWAGVPLSAERRKRGRKTKALQTLQRCTQLPCTVKMLC